MTERSLTGPLGGSHDWPWPRVGRLLDTGPLPERFPGQYSPEAKAKWQPWIEAARAGASLEELKKLEPR